MAQSAKIETDADMTARLKIRIRELNILHEIAQAVTSTLDLQNVLNRIVEAAVYLTNAEEGFIMLVDEASSQLRLRAGKGLGDKAAKVMSMAVQDSLAGEVIKTGKPLIMGGRQRNDSYKVKTGYLVKSLLNVPIKGQARILGVLSVDHAIESLKTFTDHDVSLLTNLAGYASIAIENAQRYEEAAARADELARSLKEIGSAPTAPSRENDRQLLEKFNEGLKNQRQEVAQAQQWVIQLARDLHGKAQSVEEIAHRLGVWNEEVDNLLPQLDWIAQTALVKGGTAPLEAPSSPDSELIATLEVILNNTTDGVLLCDPKGKILNANMAAETMFKRAGGKLAGKTLPQLIPGDAHWEQIVNSLRLALSLGKKVSAPPPCTASLYLDEDIIKAVLLPTGATKPNSVAIVVIFKCVTAQSEGWRARDEALNVLSENLRSPMAAISSYTDLMLSESVGLITRNQRRYLQKVKHNVNKMEESLIASTSRPGYFPSMAGADQFNVSETLKNTVETVRGELGAEGRNLAASIPANLPPVPVATDYFSRIITDLLLRAAAHMQKQETLEMTTLVTEEAERPAYLVISLKSQVPNSNIKEVLDQDAELKTIAKAVEYQGGRVWTDIDYNGRWIISFLLPTAI